jgi:uncharacterized protein (TIGR03437 family)
MSLRAKFLSSIICVTCAITNPIFAQPVITTAAGTDLVFGSNGKPAKLAALGRNSRVTTDPTGRPVFSDPNYNLVFRLNADGTIQTIAGNNVQGLTPASNSQFPVSGGGYSGDYGPATMAALNRPEGVAYDKAGNLYIADAQNHRIRMVDTQGIITTIAGNGVPTYNGDGLPALSTSFQSPTDVAVDNNGNVYVNDTSNYRIRMISQGIVSTFAGTGVRGNGGDNIPARNSAVFDVEAMILDASGNLYYADWGLNRVRRISAGQVTTVAGFVPGCPATANGPVSSVALCEPGGLAFQGNNLLIADSGNSIIRMLSGSTMTTIGGTGLEGFSGDGQPALNASFHAPFGLAVDSTGNIYIADRENSRIRLMDTTGTVSTVAGSGTLIPSQNGVSPSLATFFDPVGVRFDSAGAMMVADTDNNIVRRGNPDGTLATIAGTGAGERSGDNGPALQAGLYSPFSVTDNHLGELLVTDPYFGTLREFTIGGSIATIAASTSGVNVGAPVDAVTDANGNIFIADYASGAILRRGNDGSLGIFTSGFLNPAGLAMDSLGNLYVTEYSGGRVWSISPSGTPTLLAGGGTVVGSAAEGAPATSVKLGRPAGVAVDGTGVVYFSDAATATVRRVDLNRKISTVAGNGIAGYTGDGGPATSASLNGPWGVALDSSGSLYIADELNNRVRKVLLTSAPSFTVNQTSLSLAAAGNGSPTDPVAITLSGSLTGMLYTTSVDSAWLQVSPSGGAMPSTLQVLANPAGMSAGTYFGSVTVSAPGANPAARVINVTFTVSAAVPASLASDTTTLSFAFVSGASPVTRQVSILNLGSGSLSYSLSAATASGTGWLSLSSSVGTSTPSTPGSTTVTVDPGQLQPGTYTGSITITSTAANSPVAIPVSASVVAPVTKLQLTQAGLTFTAVAGGGAPLPRTFGVFNAGQGAMTWSAAISGGSWLNIDSATGSVATPLTDVSQVIVSVDPSGLAVGSYYGTVNLTAVGNSPQVVMVALNVLDPKSAPPPDINPGGLVFYGVTGSSPSSQIVSIANVTAAPITYSSSRLVQSGSPWFVQNPANGQIAPNQPMNLVVQPDYTNLAPGTYQGSVALQFSDGSTGTVNILAVVLDSSSGTGALLRRGRSADALRAASSNGGCTPSGNLTVMLTLAQQPLPVVLGQAVTLQATFTDNCGPVSGANDSIGVGFSNQDDQVNLAPEPTQPGVWTNTWVPRHQGTGTITIHVVAQEPIQNTVGQAYYTASAKIVAANGPPPPIIPAGAALNGASFVAGIPVAPGGLITIIGDNLSTATGVQLQAPLPTSLGGTQILLGGIALPLTYASNNQINAQVPPNVSTDTLNQILVQRADNVPSVPVNIAVAQASPAVFTEAQSGQGQARVNITATGADNAVQPATAGDLVTIYCTGLGAVNPYVPAGQPGGGVVPGDGGVSSTVNPVNVTIGGVQAQVDSAILSPGLAGVYQVNAYVPAGVTPGDQVPLFVTVVNQQSPPVTMRVH